MVKAEVKTPNKRKSLAPETPSKKVKVDNGKSPQKKPQTPKLAPTPKVNQQKSPAQQKPNQKSKKAKTNGAAPKPVKPFKGTQKFAQKPKGPVPAKKQGAKPKVENAEKKKKRRNQFASLVAEVQEKSGTKDVELLKKLDEKIKSVAGTGTDLTKTAKKKLSTLKKFKSIVTEGAAAVSAKNRAEKQKNGKKALVQVQTKKPAPKQPVAVKTEEEEDSDDDGDVAEDDSDAEEEVSNDEEDDDEDGEGDDDDGEEDDDDDESDEEEEESYTEFAQQFSTAKPSDTSVKAEKSLDISEKKFDIAKKTEKKVVKTVVKAGKKVDIDQLKKSDIVKKGQKRFVLFVGNIAYDTTKDDLKAHFNKVGEIVDIRIPTEKGSNRPRGFAYVEVKDETAYEKCMSMHHSHLNQRRINVLYTQGGKKKGEDQKKEIKAKNFKLHAMRRQGQLVGSVKQSQKRAFRRKNAKREDNE